MAMKGQNAIEFISTYAIVITIITVAIALVIVFANAGRSIIPSQCSFFGGFVCRQALYTTDTPNGGSQLFLVAADSQPGIVNITAFNAVIGGGASIAGYCTPALAMAGQTVYCIANFSAVASSGSVYSGTFSITANYCAQNFATASNYTCLGDSSYTYGGAIQLQGTSTTHVVGSGYYMTVNVVNTQSQAIASGFDQNVILTSAYSSYESGSMGNVRFYDGAKELYSWCESGCTNASSSTTFWVKTDKSIPANNGLITMQVYFLPLKVNYDGVFAGEAPQLSATYGQYDNGGSVFNKYLNFKGTSLPSGWSVSSGLTVTVNNGLTSSYDSIAGVHSIYYTPSSISLPIVLETYSKSQTSAYVGPMLTDNSTGTTDYGTFMTNGDHNYFELDPQANLGGSWTNGVMYVLGFMVESTTDYSGQVNYSTLLTGTSAITSATYYMAIFSSDYPTANVTSFTQWFRTRAYPPSGIMPSATFGTISAAK